MGIAPRAESRGQDSQPTQDVGRLRWPVGLGLATYHLSKLKVGKIGCTVTYVGGRTLSTNGRNVMLSLGLQREQPHSKTHALVLDQQLCKILLRLQWLVRSLCMGGNVRGSSQSRDNISEDLVLSFDLQTIAAK